MTRSQPHSLWRRIHSAIVWVVLSPVALYRLVLSPMKRTPSCRFLPTCSEYAIEAVRKRGVVVGGALATWRLLRCHPFCRGGYVPVSHEEHGT